MILAVGLRVSGSLPGCEWLASPDRHTTLVRLGREPTDDPMNAGRLTQLDGLRALAVLSVIVWHYVAAPLQAAGHRFDGVEKLLLLTWSGVDLFLVLSGYLIADILFKARDATNYFRVFFWRRFCRLMPLYALLLASFFVARALLAGEATFQPMLESNAVAPWTYFVLVQNVGMALQGTFGAGWLTPTWSLALEWQFYLILPLLIRYAPRRVVLTVAVGAIVAAPLLRALVPPLVGYVSLPTRMDSLFLGVILAHALSRPHTVAACQRAPRTCLLGLAILFVGVLAMALRPEAFGAVNSWYGTFTHSWLACTYAGLLAYLVVFPESLGSRVLARRPLVLLGQLAYAAYLIHQPVVRVLFALTTGGEPDLSTAGGIGLTLAGVGLTFGIAWVLYNTVETRFIALGRKVHYDYGEAATRTPMPAATPRPVVLVRR